MLPKTIQNLIDEFHKLPSIGPKMASRIVFHLLKQEQQNLESFANKIIELKTNLHLCNICQNYSTDSICEICNTSNRDTETICIVETPLDLIAIEKTSTYKGAYHVLHGVLSPINNIGPNDIKLYELFERINKNNIEEIIIALNTNLDADSTATYIIKHINNPEIKITRLGVGLPIGAYIEYTDEITIKKAIENRVNY